MMHDKKGRSVAALVVQLILLGAGPAIAAGSEVHVQFQDQSTSIDVEGMSMKVQPATVPAGHVTFMAQNNSKDTIHEMLVVKVDSPATQLPGIKKGAKLDKDKLDEDLLHSLGEVSELKPGEQGSLELTLKPGLYRLLCNQRTHYRSGMTTLLTVAQ